MDGSEKLFDKVFVINLAFKQDRLSSFMSFVPRCLGKVTTWQAVHGDTVRHPNWWTAGNGAWGCYRSHLGILEYCYNSQFESYAVFEDDAIFRPEFEEQLQSFMGSLPDDWEQVYFGGQLLHEVANPPRRINENCFSPYNVNRTHAFAVHRRGYEKLYQFLNAVPFQQAEHIDHHLGRLHESGTLKVYVPPRWLVGQDGGPSNISGKCNPPSYWVDPEVLEIPGRFSGPLPAIYLEADVHVAIELSNRGWHRGYWVDDDHVDHGVNEAMSSADRSDGLKVWFDQTRPEAIRDQAKCVCLFHPALTPDRVDELPFAVFHHIKAESVEQAEHLFENLLYRCAAM